MDCALCNEPITNPLCQDCLAEAIEQWLHETAPERIEGLHKETDILSSHGDTACVHCKAHFGLCTYCYTKHIFNWLHDGKLQLEFLEFFNFDLYQLKPYEVRIHG